MAFSNTIVSAKSILKFILITASKFNFKQLTFNSFSNKSRYFEYWNFQPNPNLSSKCFSQFQPFNSKTILVFMTNNIVLNYLFIVLNK